MSVYPGELLDENNGKLCEVAIKQFPGSRFY
jgi:hypothetical protein